MRVRPKPLLAVVAAASLIQLGGPLPMAEAVTLPAGFSDTGVVAVPVPTGLAWTPDGRMLVAQQTGQLRVVRGGTLNPAPALDLSARTCSEGERGMQSVLVDPRFATNHFIYLYWTHKAYGGCPTKTADAPENRVTRYVLGDDDRVVAGSETVLVDHLTSFASNHNGGDMHVGADGYLYVSVGDSGCQFTDASRCGPLNANSRRLDVPHGKILRVTMTGGIPGANPYAGAPGARRCTDPAGVPAGTGPCAETFASGFRNPWRFAQRPGTSSFYVNDVGQYTWEEIDALKAGADYGWNVREGHCATGSTTDCGSSPYTAPIYDYAHSSGCSAITGGVFVPTGLWPAPYSGSYLFSDYSCGKVFRLAPKAGGGYSRVAFLSGLGSNSATTLAFGPYGTTSALYYTTYGGGGQVRRVTHTDANSAPVAAFSATTGGTDGLTATLDGGASYDPDSGDAVASRSWDFGDGTTAVTTGPTKTHTYAAAGSYTVRLVVKDTHGLASAPVTRTVVAGNSRPTVSITSPAGTARFAVGQAVTVTASASDPEDGPLPGSSLTWTIARVHGNHTHPWLGPVTGSSVSTTYPAPEDLASTTNSWLRVKVVARDSAGATRTVVRKLLPHLVTLRLASEPSGAELRVNDVAFTTPGAVTSWEGWQVQLAASDQTIAGQPHVFRSWSDGGAATHTVTTPAVDTTYTATFTASGSPPGPWRLRPPASISGATGTAHWSTYWRRDGSKFTALQVG